jgi:hypothetical protein
LNLSGTKVSCDGISAPLTGWASPPPIAPRLRAEGARARRPSSRWAGSRG